MIERFTQKQFKENALGKKDDDLYPILVYVYNKDGFYSHPVRVYNKTELAFIFETAVVPAINEKREVRMTDTGDLLVFHSYNGCIKYDGMTHHECEKCRESN